MPAGERYFSRRTFAFRIPPISQRYPPLINSDTRTRPFSLRRRERTRVHACRLFQYLEHAPPNGLLSPTCRVFPTIFSPSDCRSENTEGLRALRLSEEANLFAIRPVLPLTPRGVVRGKQFSRFWHIHEPRRGGSRARPAKSAISITHNRRRPPPSCRHGSWSISLTGSNMRRVHVQRAIRRSRESASGHSDAVVSPSSPIFLHLSRVRTGTTTTTTTTTTRTTRRTTMTTTC